MVPFGKEGNGSSQGVSCCVGMSRLSLRIVTKNKSKRHEGACEKFQI